MGDRPARNSMLCPRCGRLISSDEPVCPHCALRRPGARWRSLGIFRLFDDPLRLKQAIFWLNVGMYGLSLLFNPMSTGLSYNPLTVFSPGQDSLLLLGATGTLPIDRFGRWWTLITANYLHGNLLHIGFNMIAFHQLSPLVLREYGNHRALTLYTLGGVAGFAASYAAGVPFTIGASAAVCALMGALLYYGRSRGGIYGTVIYKQVGAWAVSLFIFGFLVPGINNWGHAGGLAGGALLAWLLGYRERAPERPLHRLLSWICAGATVLALGWAAVTAAVIRLG